MPVLLIDGSPPPVTGKRNKRNALMDAETERLVRAYHRLGWDFLGSYSQGVGEVVHATAEQLGAVYRLRPISLRQCNEAVAEADCVFALWDTRDDLPLALFTAAIRQGKDATLFVIANRKIHTYSSWLPPVPPSIFGDAVPPPAWYQRLVTCLTPVQQCVSIMAG